MNKRIVKYLITIAIVLTFISCSEDKPSFNSVNGGESRANNYEGIKPVFSNNIKFKELKFDGKIDSSGFMFPPFMLSAYDYLYISNDNKVHLTTEDRVLSSLDLGKDFIVSNPCKDKQGNVYFQTQSGSIYSYNITDRKAPVLNWVNSVKSNDTCIYSDLVYHNGNIYSASSNYGLKVYNDEGKKLYSIEINNLLKDFAISDEGTIYLSTSQDDYTISDTLFAIENGKVKFKKSVEGRLYTAPICFKNEIIVPVLFQIKGDNFIRILRLDNNGNLISKVETNIITKYISADSKGDIYTVSSNAGLGQQVSYLNKYDKQGKKLWSLVVDIDVNSPLLVCDDALAFCGERNRATGLFYVDKNNGKLLSSMSLSNVPEHSLVPVYKNSGGILLGATNTNGLIIAELSDFDKLLR